MSDYRTLSEGLHSLYDEVLYEPLPVRLRVDHYRGRASWRDRLQRWFGFGVFGLTPRLVGLAALLAASAAGGWWLHSSRVVLPEVETPAMSFARQATSAHLVYRPGRPPSGRVRRRPGREACCSGCPSGWAQAVHAPKLQDLGFTLVGGRLLPAGERACRAADVRGPGCAADHAVHPRPLDDVVQPRPAGAIGQLCDRGRGGPGLLDRGPVRLRPDRLDGSRAAVRDRGDGAAAAAPCRSLRRRRSRPRRPRRTPPELARELAQRSVRSCQSSGK